MFHAARAGKPTVKPHDFQAEVRVRTMQVFPGGKRIVGSGTAQGFHLHGIQAEQAAFYFIGKDQAAILAVILRPQPVDGDGASAPGIDQDGRKDVFAPVFFPDGQVKITFPEEPVGDTGGNADVQGYLRRQGNAGGG